MAGVKAWKDIKHKGAVSPEVGAKIEQEVKAEAAQGLAIGAAGSGLAAGGPHGGLVERVESHEPATEQIRRTFGDEPWAEDMAKHMLTPEEQEARAKDLAGRAAQNISHGPGLAAQADPHVFVQFNATVMVHDTRGMEQLVDRATVGKVLGDHGEEVATILLVGAWFEIMTASAPHLPPGKTYRIPVSNVRSARR